LKVAAVNVAVVIVAGGIWLVLLAGRASAHPGIEDPYLSIGVASTVALGVPSELPSPMVEIDVTLPTGFTLQRVDSVPGWQESTTPGHIRYAGGDVAQGGYALFTFSGVFAVKAVVPVPVVTRAADGTTVDWDQPPTGALPAAVAFPGYPLGSSPIPGVAAAGTTTGGGFSPNIPIFVVAMLGAATWFGLRARRRSTGYG
jgi:uncharacterized protein YcnI